MKTHVSAVARSVPGPRRCSRPSPAHVPIGVLASMVAMPLFARTGWAQADFRVLPLAPTMQNAEAEAVSADGGVITGGGNGPGTITDLAYLWTPSGGSVLIPPLPGFVQVGARAISGDGRTIGGQDYSADYSVIKPYVWTTAGGTIPLPLLAPSHNGFVSAISRDGSTVVGDDRVGPGSTGPAVFWRAGQVTSLGIPVGWTSSGAIGVSSDGSVIAGGVFDEATSREAAFRWTAAGGMELLPLPGPGGRAYASGISDDGRVIVGFGGASSATHHALRWRNGGPPEDLGVLPGAIQSDCFAASADGSIIVGNCIFPGSTQRAFVYTDQSGMIDLTALLLARGVDLHGLILTVCFSLTPDGSVLVGGTDGSAWRLSVPGWFCYSNCDASSTPPILNINDFVCFMNHFVAGDAYANCDQSTTPPTLNVNDFICFQNRFASGCD